ncbi:fumarylacetoacetate hydrolase family protein [Rhodococcus sp. JVH1]|uniref:fumarylacetoacetate hydrolase family protein n=1 Tax=Rhodococcus sp. JVH1 TaxID=745408 RepID=UPI0002721335|nr:fumarylacetoacetate hydrolase family protein [Rhodococcus sp. JVH1]EJI95723.1 fumarylacetoacetate (FAA) hydrolase family protein [Rhodococcus sp. JVH1]
MKILSYRTATGHDSVGALVSDDTLVDLSSLIPAPASGVSPIRLLLQATEGRLQFQDTELAGRERIALDTVTVAPLVADPTKIIAAPVNYRDHQAEMMEDYHIDALGVFLKAPSSVIGHGETIRLPYTDRRFDQEGELALVIGRTTENVSIDNALAAVAGYTCLLDITMRGGEDRSTRKSFDTFTPVGPYLVTPDEVGPLASLQLRTHVNGTLRQDADIADLIWGVPELVSYASSVMTLHPGDIITTGTPAGIGQIHDGDTVSVEIDRIGALTVTVSAAGAVACPTKGAVRGPKPPAEITPVRSRVSPES